jgi:hypothetical protein
MSIQVTPIPRLTVLTVPEFTLGTANAAGSASTAIASDSTLLVYDTTAPTTIPTAGVSAAVGTAGTSARRDHIHGMYDQSANQGIAKAWCVISSSGSLHSGSYNVSGVTDTGTGLRDIAWSTPFADTEYSATGSIWSMSESRGLLTYSSFATGSVRLKIYDLNSDPTDVATSSIAFGEQ